MSDLPIVMTKDGLQPQSPASLRDQLIALVSAQVPDYTANLPGSLIENIASTDVGAMVLIDQARVDLVNSITPFGANEFLLNQLGEIYGIMFGQPTNASVFVTFTSSPGLVINKGFIVSDGNHQYHVIDGGIIGSDGTVTLFCVASESGIWPIPQNTVGVIITSVPASYSLTVINHQAGTPSSGQESENNYRSRVLQAGKSASQGMASYLRTLVNNVPGVQSRLISIRQVSNQWQILVGGGDPYAVGFAIFQALFDINNLIGSTIDAGRNVIVSVVDPPDNYNIIYVNPVAQSVIINITWNTTLTNFISDASISVLVSTAISNYINSLYVGDKINEFELTTIFQQAVSAFIPAQYLSRFIYQIYIDSILTAPNPGTGLVEGDPESYFITDQPSIVVTRG